MKCSNCQILNRIKEEAVKDIAKLTEHWGIYEKYHFFLCAIGIFDKYFIDKISDLKDGQHYSFNHRLIDSGYSVLFELFYSVDFCNFQKIILKPLTQEDLNLYSKIICECGIIGWMRSLIEDVKVGYLKYSSLGNNARLKFRDKYHWNEYIEGEYLLWYSEYVAYCQSEYYEKLNCQRPDIIAKMRANVSVWNEHFMCYTNDIEVEDYFNMQALLDAQQATEWDLFPPDAKFEGIDYGTIMQAIVDFAGYAIKHLTFADLLYSTDSNLIFENLILCAFTKEDIIHLIEQNQKINRYDAEKIFDLISLTPDNIKYYCDNVKAASAPFIKLSKDQYVRSIRGLLDRPFEFMLYNLHTKCSNDWDLNSKKREAIFRENIYDLFHNTCFICLNKPIVIRVDNARTLTDIDAVIIDKLTHEVALFQLKWQDPTTNSAYELKSKASNYNKAAQKWVQDIERWLQNCDSEKLSSVLGVKKKLIDINKIYIFVIGRKHGNYSGSTKPTDNCAWAQWYQFLYTVKQLEYHKTLTIGKLHNQLVSCNPFNSKIIESTNEFKYDKYRIILGGGIIQ